MSSSAAGTSGRHVRGDSTATVAATVGSAAGTRQRHRRRHHHRHYSSLLPTSAARLAHVVAHTLLVVCFIMLCRSSLMPTVSDSSSSSVARQLRHQHHRHHQQQQQQSQHTIFAEAAGFGGGGMGGGMGDAAEPATTTPPIVDRHDKPVPPTTKNVPPGFTVARMAGDRVLDDCCCDVDTLRTNNEVFYNPILSQLSATDFFKYFKVDLNAPCPFWAKKTLCTGDGSGCHVNVCEDEETLSRMCAPDSGGEGDDDDSGSVGVEQTEAAAVLFTDVPLDFDKWDDIDAGMWVKNHFEGREASFVDLTRNVEGNTGYSGADPRRIWNAIYSENCFTGPLDDMCFEERVINRLMSGLHTHITTQVFYNYKQDQFAKHRWHANVTLWNKVMRPHADRLENLHFSFLFVLRAIKIAEPYFVTYPYNTGNPVSDAAAKQLIADFLASDMACDAYFDESLFFRGQFKASLRKQAQNNFRNISLIMDCVACDKCKMWSKMMVLGFGTSLKLMLAERQPNMMEAALGLRPSQREASQTLQRNEMVALINTAMALSNSIKATHWFFDQPYDPTDTGWG